MNNPRYRHALQVSASAIIMSGLCNTPAAAQAQDPPADPSVQPEKVLVTGSRIRGVGPVGSNVISAGSELIANTAPLNVSDLLKSVPQVVNLGYDESSFSSTTGIGNVTRASGVNIHGLGPQATLVLFDGHRFPMQGPQASFVDPSSIPVLALERVEIVPDGTSAIYGSDAVAGVVSLIPRRYFDGVQATGRLGYASGYRTRQAGVIAGKNWDNGQVWVALERSEHSNLAGTDRGFFQSNLVDRGGADYRPLQCNPGNIVISGRNYAIPAGQVTPSTLVAGTQNRCDTTRFADILPEQERNSGAFRASLDIGDNLTLWAEGFLSRRTFNANVTSQGSTTVLASLAVPRTNAYFVAPQGLSPNSETIQYSFLKEWGPIRQTGFDRTGGAYLGADITLPGGWKANLVGLYGKNTSNAENLQVNASALNAALASNNPATAFNPYGTTVNSQDMLNRIFSNIFNPNLQNTLSGFEARADGPLFRLPAGQVRLAAGVEYDVYKVDGYTARGPVSAPLYTNTNNSRNVKSVYVELFVPVIGSGNRNSGGQRVDLSIAGRHDRYSDVGSTSNPKLGLNWLPTSDLAIKASYGRSFRAPFLTDTLLLRPGTTIAGATLTDPLSSTGQSSGIRYVAGNPNLSPEKAATHSLGFDFRPSAVKGLALNATYFSIKYDNQISSQLQNNAILQQAALYPSLITRNPTPAQVAALTAQGLAVSGVLPANPAFLIDGRPTNLGKSVVHGIDFGAHYDWSAAEKGKFQLGADGTYNTTYKVAQSPSSPLVEQINSINYPLRLRLRGNFGWKLGKLSSMLYVNHWSGYTNNTVTPLQQVPSWATADLHLGYALDDREGAPLTVSVDINNLTNRTPPFVNIDGGYDSQQASAVGRLISLTLSKKW